MRTDSEIEMNEPLAAGGGHVVWGFALAAGAGSVAYNVLLGNFMVLFVHRIGFSPLLIGLVCLLVRLATLFQIWAGRYVDRHGCKKPLISAFAWGPILLVPFIFAPQFGRWLGEWATVTSVLLGLTTYVLVTYIAQAAWFPLLRHNLPPHRSMELVGRITQLAMLFGVIATAGFALMLTERPSVWRYQAIFIATALIAMARALWVRKVNDVPPLVDGAPEPVYKDLRGILSDLPFRRLLIFVAISYAAAGMVVPFRPLYVVALGFSERFAAILTVALIGASYAIVCRAWGILADRYGSRGIYVLAGVIVTVAHGIAVLPRRAGLLDAAILALGLMAVAVGWAGLDAANVRRLFVTVPRRNQALYMVVYVIVADISMAIGSFVGGVCVKAVQVLSGKAEDTGWFALALEYRVLFLVGAALTVIAVGYSRRMLDLKEISAPRLLSQIRLRTQRWLMNGGPAVFLRFRQDEEDRDR